MPNNNTSKRTEEQRERLFEIASQLTQMWGDDGGSKKPLEVGTHVEFKLVDYAGRPKAVLTAEDRAMLKSMGIEGAQ